MKRQKVVESTGYSLMSEEEFAAWQAQQREDDAAWDEECRPHREAAARHMQQVVAEIDAAEAQAKPWWMFW